LIVFWTLTLINLKGLHVSTLINNICATIGTVIPMIFLITLGIIWVIKGQPLQIHIGSDTLIPSLSQSTNWISLIAIMASFLGIELSGVHVNDIHNPQRNFPRAVLLASFFIFATMLLGSLAIAFVLPEKSIHLVSGVMQVFSNFFEVFGIRALTPVLTLMIVIGSIGSITNWLISPAKGLLHAAEFGFLPAFFTHKNKAGVASHLLLAQAILVSLFCLIFLLVPSVNAFYWFLTALSTELYMIMYILMFCSAVKLHYSYSDRPAAFKIPGKHWGMWITALLGHFGCTTTIIVSFFPPGNVDIGSASRYLSMICIGNVATLSPVLLFYLYKRRRILKGP
jgi:amino acid transporter